MNQARVRLRPQLAAALLGLSLVALPEAQAQNLEHYASLHSALSRAQAVRPNDVGAALDELDRAETAFAQLRPGLRDSQLAQSIQATLDQARGALARTPTDLSAQTTYAQALLRQGLYVQTLQDLLQSEQSAEDPGDGAAQELQARLQRLAQEFRLSDTETAALNQAAQAGRPAEVAAWFQRAAARQLVQELAPWGSGAASSLSQTEAYLRLSRASGWHLHLSEPSGPPPTEYTAALQQLAQGDLAGAAPAIRQLLSGAKRTAAQFEGAAKAPDEPASHKPAPQALTATAAAPSPSSREVNSQTGVQQPEAGQPSQQAQEGAIVVTHQPSADTSAPSESAQSATKTHDAVYAALARALTAASAQDKPALQAALTQAVQALDTLAAGQQGGNPHAAELADLSAHLSAMSQRPWVAPDDVTTELGHFRALERQLQGAEPSATAQVQNFAPHLWNGRVQAAAFLLLALVVPLPFYFRFRALGHQQGEWKLIMSGIGIILIPAFLEGLVSMASCLGTMLKNPALSSAAVLSVTRNPLGHFLWWLLTLTGVLSMMVGFYRLSRPRAKLALAKARWTSARTQEEHVSADTAPGSTASAHVSPQSIIVSWTRPSTPPSPPQPPPSRDRD